jgi:hypothetical protein
MSKIKFYQIVIPDNPVSMEYHEISKKSFECVSDIIEIVPFEAITPQTPDFEEREEWFNWQPSRSGLEVINRLKPTRRTDIDKPHSPTERAGMMSHWELMRLRGESNEDFYVTEHDTFLRPEHEEVFRELLDLKQDYRLHYSNIGLFMGCYSMSKRFSHYAYHLLRNKSFPINSGPYGCMERLFKTFIKNFHKNHASYWRSEATFIHPWVCCTRLNIGKNEAQMNNTYNFDFDEIFPDVPESSYYPVPTTQVVSKRLLVTQDHREYPPEQQEKPWVRHGDFHIID